MGKILRLSPFVVETMVAIVWLIKWLAPQINGACWTIVISLQFPAIRSSTDFLNKLDISLCTFVNYYLVPNLQAYNGDDYNGARIVSRACELRDSVCSSIFQSWMNFAFCSACMK